MVIWAEYSEPLMFALPVIVLGLLYVLRQQAHHFLERLAKSLHRLLRIAARSCLHAEQRIRLRNHEVTKALAESLMERQLERRFMRIERLVERDLESYKKLSAQINGQLTVISEDYDASAEVPNPAPEWIAAVEAIANLEEDQCNTDVMARILADMHATVKDHQREALREHRWTVSARHKVLAGLRPQWRKMAKLLDHIDHNIEILRQRLRQVDRHMGQFELLTAGSGQGIMSSMFMRFVIALSFVTVGTAAAWVNLQLLAQPLAVVMAERQIADLPLAELITLLHIGVTLAAAALITESLKITHLLPLAGAMTHRGRSMMTWLGVILLVLVIGLESTALLGTPLVEAPVVQSAAVGTAVTEAVTAPLTTVEVALAGTSTMIGLTELSAVILALMGITIPLVVAVSIIPLEYLLHTVRPVVGTVIQVLMHISALVLRLCASLAIDLGRVAVIIYDTVIFLPLMVERAVLRRKSDRYPVGASSAVAASQPTANAENVTALRFGATNSLDQR